MKYLVTGANGFIAQSLIPILASNTNNEILITSRNELISNIFKKYSNIKYIKHDVNNNNINLFEYFEHPDVLIHLAWDLLPNYNNIRHIEQVYFDNYKFVKNLVVNGVRNINITGTCLEYGLINGLLDEDLPTNPTTSYGIAKDMLRKSLMLLQKEVAFNLKWIRLFYIYNPHNNKSKLIEDIQLVVNRKTNILNLSKCDQIRDYSDLDEICQKIVNISSKNFNIGEINCCSGKPISVREIIDRLLEYYKIQPNINYGYYDYPSYEPFAFWGSNIKYKTLIGE